MRKKFTIYNRRSWPSSAYFQFTNKKDNRFENSSLKIGNFSSGQSLFEVVFALGIVATILVGIVSLATTSIRNSTFSKNNSLATRYAQEGIEWVRGERDSGWMVFSGRAVGGGGAEYCLGTLAWSACGTGTIGSTIFDRRVVLTLAAPDEVSVLVTVAWDDSQGSHEASSATVLYNWK